MFDLGMSELLVIGIVALIVIGPKDLPELFRSLGRFTAKMRGMAREFSRAMEAAADEAGVKDVAKDIKAATSAKSMGLDAVKDAASKFEKWDPLKNAARPSTPTPKPVVETAAATTAPASKPMGPATQALADTQAARKAVALDAAEKLRKPVPDPAAAPPAKAPSASKPAKAPPKRAAKPADAAAAPKKPRTPTPKKPPQTKADA